MPWKFAFSIRFWKQFLHTSNWIYVIPTPWNVKKSLPYFTPIENKFLSQFREPSLATTGSPLHLLATEDLLLTPQLVGAVTGRFAKSQFPYENLPGIKWIHPMFVCNSLSLMKRNKLGRHKGTSACFLLVTCDFYQIKWKSSTKHPPICFITAKKPLTKMLCKISMKHYYWILIYQNWPIDINTIDICWYCPIWWC